MLAVCTYGDPNTIGNAIQFQLYSNFRNIGHFRWNKLLSPERVQLIVSIFIYTQRWQTSFVSDMLPFSEKHQIKLR